MTLREIIYMIMDELKLMSDDSSFNEDHIKFLVNKYRAALLYQQYSKDIKKSISEDNYQTITIVLKDYSDEGLYGNDKEYKKSSTKIPNLMPFSNTKIYPDKIKENSKEVSTKSMFNYKFTWVSKDRFKFTGFNKWMKYIIYCALGEDNYLYLRSHWEDIEPLYTVNIKGIFEDVIDDTDMLDENYPLEQNLIPLLIKSVVQELAPKTMQPADTYNNANDDRSNISNYIARNIKQNAQ